MGEKKQKFGLLGTSLFSTSPIFTTFWVKLATEIREKWAKKYSFSPNFTSFWVKIATEIKKNKQKSSVFHPFLSHFG